jgi:hypothetical protein
MLRWLAILLLASERALTDPQPLDPVEQARWERIGTWIYRVLLLGILILIVTFVLSLPDIDGMAAALDSAP